MDRHTNINRQMGRWLHASLSKNVAYLQGRNSGTRNLCHFCSVPACEKVVIFSLGLTNEAFYLGHLSSQMGHQLCQCAAFQCSGALRSQGTCPCTDWPWPKTWGSEVHVSLKYAPIFIRLLALEQLHLHSIRMLWACFEIHSVRLCRNLFNKFVQQLELCEQKRVLYALAPVLQVSLLLTYKADIFLYTAQNFFKGTLVNHRMASGQLNLIWSVK